MLQCQAQFYYSKLMSIPRESATCVPSNGHLRHTFNLTLLWALEFEANPQVASTLFSTKKKKHNGGVNKLLKGMWLCPGTAKPRGFILERTGRGGIGPRSVHPVSGEHQNRSKEDVNECLLKLSKILIQSHKGS